MHWIETFQCCWDKHGTELGSGYSTGETTHRILIQGSDSKPLSIKEAGEDMASEQVIKMIS